MIYDITPPITERLAVWPGDTPPRREVLLQIERGDNVTLSTLHSTVHLGAHADAPNHYGPGAGGIEGRSLDDYLGACQVIRVPLPRGSVLGPEDLREPVVAPRVLFATGTHPDPEHFNQDFAALSVELIEELHRRRVQLVGIYTPSVDRFDSADLLVHRAILKHDLSILEGLVLAGVPAGLYELIALPLPLVGFDASPVRAILRTPA